MSKPILLLLFVLVSLGASAQNTGYEGKHFLAKFDLASMAISSRPAFTVEAVAGRTFSISLGYAFSSSTSYPQNYPASAYPYIATAPINPLGANASFSENAFIAEIRIYGNKIIPAPKGTYVFFHVEAGSGTASGQYYANLTDANNYNLDIKNYNYSSLSIQQYSGGIGYQEIFGGRVVLDVSAGLVGTSITTSEDAQNSPKILSNIASQFGPTLNFSGANTSSFNYPRTGTFGCVISVKLGALLF